VQSEPVPRVEIEVKMKTLLTTASVLIALAAAGPAGLGQPSGGGSQGQLAEGTTQVAPPTAAAVFELKYRGLSAPDDPLSYRSYWGWGGYDGSNDPFVQAVKSRVGECTVVYNGSLSQAKWAVVELKNKKPVALYFDADGDGKPSEQERLVPAAPLAPGFPYAFAFITPDFLMQTKDRQEIPFRVLLVANWHDAGDASYMWSPCCVLEGQATLAGEPRRLVLYANGFSGSFTTFGSCSFALLPAGQKANEPVSRNTLSSLIQYQGTFYRVNLAGTHAKDQTVSVTFQKDTTPTGQLAVEVKGKETLKARVSHTTITGVTDPSVHLGVPDALSALPVGRYQLTSGTANYGVQSDGEWQVTFNEGPDLAIEAAQTSRIEIGTPTLSISAIREQDRYSSDVKEQSSFKCGTQIFIAPQIKGAKGEMYVRFSQKGAGSGPMIDVKPHLTIAGPDGKQVASSDMEYG
jgi:hypothetical protein